VLAVAAAATAAAAVEHQSGEAAPAPAMAAFPALRSADMHGGTSVPRFRSEQEEPNSNGNHASSPSMLVFSGINSAFALKYPFVVVTYKKVPLYIGITNHIVVVKFDSSVVVKESWQLQQLNFHQAVILIPLNLPAMVRVFLGFGFLGQSLNGKHALRLHKVKQDIESNVELLLSESYNLMHSTPLTLRPEFPVYGMMLVMAKWKIIVIAL
jgi:hypothetical protein